MIDTGLSNLDWLVPLLVCPACRRSLELTTDEPGQGLLTHASGDCNERYPVIDEIPRLLTGRERFGLASRYPAWFARTPQRKAILENWCALAGPGAEKLIADFDFEWRHFSTVGTQELTQVFEQYFDQIPLEAFREGALVLDAGSGNGRWAYQVATRGPRVVAVDLGLSVELARSNTASTGRVAVVQADLRDLPLAPRAFDWAFSLGVLHHIERPVRVLERIVNVIRPGGTLLLYLYYALDNRGPMFRALFASVDRVRRIFSISPRPAVFVFSALVAALVYWPLARASRLLAAIGALRVANSIPLTYYRDRSFRTMRNDSLDRFGTRVEQRFTRPEMTRLMLDAGLIDVRVSPGLPYWHATARRPVSRISS